MSDRKQSDLHVSRGGQVRIYLGKCFRLFSSEKQWKNFISAGLIMVIISMVTSPEMFLEYLPTKNGAFAVLCACIWIGLFNSIQSICRERAIIKREHRAGLHISSYLLAHVLYEFVICTGESLIILLVFLLKNAGHLPEEGLVFGKIPDLYLIFFLVTFSADLIALLISCIVKNENTAMTVMPFVLIIQLVMSGAVFPLSGISETISYITISKWGLNGVLALANTNRSIYLTCVWNEIEGVKPEAATLWGVWGRLALFCGIYFVLAVIALKQVDRDQR